jgi:hypothetical protein
MKIPALDRSWRVLGFVTLAFLLAPGIPALTLPYLTPIFSEPGTSRYGPGEIVFFYVASLHFGTLVGLPSFLILRKLRLVRWWSAALTGAGIGGGVALIFAGLGIPAAFLAVWAGSGAVAGFVFWIVLRVGGVFEQAPIGGRASHAV